MSYKSSIEKHHDVFGPDFFDDATDVDDHGVHSKFKIQIYNKLFEFPIAQTYSGSIAKAIAIFKSAINWTLGTFNGPVVLRRFLRNYFTNKKKTKLIAFISLNGI